MSREMVWMTRRVLVEGYLGLPGGSSVTIRAGSQVWSYANIHDRVVVIGVAVVAEAAKPLNWIGW
jgi:hypothetical protein